MKCEVCGTEFDEIAMIDIENCDEDGFYGQTIYCPECGEEVAYFCGWEIEELLRGEVNPK